MDDWRFDSLVNVLGTFHSRRIMFGEVLAGVLAPLGTAPPFAALAAPEAGKKKKKRTQRKKGCLRNGTRCGGKPGRKRGHTNFLPGCKQCCSGRTRGKKKRRHCVGRPDGANCTNNRQCASGQCQDGSCGSGEPFDCQVCPSGCEFTDVQAAIDAAEAGDTIRICAGTYVGNVAIDKDLTLIGEDANSTTLQGDGTASVVVLDPAATVEIQELTITGGNSSEVGGGIANDNATLTLTRVNVTGNTADTRAGGIDINSGGNVTLIDSSVTGNEPGNQGGGIFSLGTLKLVGSTVSNNTATTGGGIYNAGGTATVEDDSVTDNIPDQCDGDPVAGCDN